LFSTVNRRGLFGCGGSYSRLEAFRVFASTQWGHEHSVAHYLDFSSAVLGLGVVSGRILITFTREAKYPTDLTDSLQPTSLHF
jgi:hypothetical protein